MPDAGLIPRVADHLGLSVVRPLAGGEFGATLVADDKGRELVLKVLASEAFAGQFQRGAEIANHLRGRGYPAPGYAGTGSALGATWSLQEHRPGEIPDVMTERHMRRLLELCEMHVRAAPSPGSWRKECIARIEEPISSVLANNATRRLGEELAATIQRSSGVETLEDGFVHGDFHHRNFLAVGERITAVFDWEFASAGDWRYDLVTLAFWSTLIPWSIPPDVARIAVERMHQHCPPDILAFLVALRAIVQLDFDVRVHPERLPQIIPGLESTVAPWWRV
jgi:aminoglycoside phosphotransferase (APT) family kinase protein